jgi:hypothetical protein
MVTVLEGEDRDAVLAEFEKHRARFYALIGHCVTRYQSVEDYLSDVFSAALGGRAERASAIFAEVKGLEAKLKLISAALTGSDQAVADCWKQLLKRVADAAKARNQIAHAHAVHSGGMVKIHLGDENTPGKATRVKPPRMELRKRKGANENVWTLEKMIQEAERSSKLLEHLSAFTRRLKGETVQPTKQEPV